MRRHSKTFILFLIISFILIISNYASANECENQSSEQIEKFIRTCGDSNNIQNLGFAPIKKKANPVPGEWAYEFIKDRYPYETFPISSDVYNNKIWFYSSIKKDEFNNIPKYVWHLIISPAPVARQLDEAEAFLVNFNSKNGDVDKLDLLTSTDENIIKQSIVDGSQPVIYTNNELIDKFEKLDLNDIWEKLIANDNMKLIKCERFRNGIARTENSAFYDYTFYLHEISSRPENINLEYGYRVVSMKTITTAGDVYGFVLNEKGSCMGYDKIAAK